MGGQQSRAINLAQTVANQSINQTNLAAQSVSAVGNSLQVIEQVGVRGGTIDIEGSEITGGVTVNVEALFKAEQSNTANQDMSMFMEQLSKATVSGIALSQASEAINETRNAFNSFISQRNDALQTCEATGSATQLIRQVDGPGSTIRLKNTKISTAVNVVARCQMDVVQKNEAMQKLEVTLKQSATAESAGLDLSGFLFILLIILGGVVGVLLVAATFFKKTIGGIASGVGTTILKIQEFMTKPIVLFLIFGSVIAVVIYLVIMTPKNTEQIPMQQLPSGEFEPLSPTTPLVYPFLKLEALEKKTDPEVRPDRETWIEGSLQLLGGGAGEGEKDTYAELLNMVAPADAGAQDPKYAKVTVVYYNTQTKKYKLFEGKPDFQKWSLWRTRTNEEFKNAKQKINSEGKVEGPCFETLSDGKPNPDYNNDRICRPLQGEYLDFQENTRYWQTSKYYLTKIMNEAQVLFEQLLCIGASVFGQVDPESFNRPRDFYTQCERGIQTIYALAEKGQEATDSTVGGWFGKAARTVYNGFGGDGTSAGEDFVAWLKKKEADLKKEYRVPESLYLPVEGSSGEDNRQLDVMWKVLFGHIDPTGKTPAEENDEDVVVCTRNLAAGEDPSSQAALDKCTGPGGERYLIRTKNITFLLNKLYQYVNGPMAEEIYQKMPSRTRNLPEFKTMKDDAKNKRERLLTLWFRKFDEWKKYFPNKMQYNTGDVVSSLDQIRDVTFFYANRAGEKRVRLGTNSKGESRFVSPWLFTGGIIAACIVVFIIMLVFRRYIVTGVAREKVKETYTAMADKLKAKLKALREQKQVKAIEKEIAMIEIPAAAPATAAPATAATAPAAAAAPATAADGEK
jgi:hypothetical protein